MTHKLPLKYQYNINLVYCINDSYMKVHLVKIILYIYNIDLYSYIVIYIIYDIIAVRRFGFYFNLILLYLIF